MVSPRAAACVPYMLQIYHILLPVFRIPSYPDWSHDGYLMELPVPLRVHQTSSEGAGWNPELALIATGAFPPRSYVSRLVSCLKSVFKVAQSLFREDC